MTIDNSSHDVGSEHVSYSTGDPVPVETTHYSSEVPGVTHPGTSTSATESTLTFRSTERSDRAAKVETPRGYDATGARRYEFEMGHGFTLPNERPAWTADVTTVLAGVAADFPGQPRVLDIGCGTGKFTRLVRDVLHDQLGLDPQVDGVDASADMLDIAREQGTQDITYSVADARRLNLDRQYDLVVSCQALDSFENPAELLADWRENVLKPGGHVMTVLSFSRPEGWTNRTAEELDRMPLARATSIEPLLEATERAGYTDVRAGFLPTVSPLHGGATSGTTGPVGSRYYVFGSAPADG